MGARSGQCGPKEGPCRLFGGLGSHVQGQGGHYRDLPEVPVLSLCDAVLTFTQVGVAPGVRCCTAGQVGSGTPQSLTPRPQSLQAFVFKDFDQLLKRNIKNICRCFQTVVNGMVYAHMLCIFVSNFIDHIHHSGRGSQPFLLQGFLCWQWKSEKCLSGTDSLLKSFSLVSQHISLTNLKYLFLK